MSSWPTRTARLYVRADRFERRVRTALEVVHQGMWLGLMGPESLRGATALYYAGAGKYADRDYNLSGLHPWETDVVRRHFGACRSVLVAAAGGGREAFALERLGLAVTAFDCADGLVSAANALAAAEGLAVRIALAPPDAVPDGPGAFDGAVIGWGGYMHIPGRPRRVAFLGQLRAHLAERAPVLLSFFERQASARRFHAIRAIAAAVRHLRLSREPVELGDTLAGSFDHHFTREELASELAEGGFEAVEFVSTPYAHAVARARPAPAA